jgi:N-acyl-D-aspartate/D-glutamate deacylase
MHTVLRGAALADGTGGPVRRADVEIAGDRIAAVGLDVAAGDAEEVDLSGLVLAPGFVDVHTHLDAQVFWDPDLTPSSWHGVTTAVQGNCGFGIAPARSEDRQLIMQTLQLVEGMNLGTLQRGIRWEFETFPDYVDTLRALPKRINVAPMVPHSMVRLYVMGDEAAFSRAATPAELSEIRRLVREAMQAGAIGVSTSQAPSHQGPQGRPVPSRFADEREIAVLLEVLGELGRGIAEITYGPLFEIEDCARLSDKYGVRVTWGSVLPGLFGGPGAAMDMLERGVRAGGDLWPQTSTRFITTHMSMQNPYAWSRLPAFKEVLGRGTDAMVASYADPQWRAAAKAQTQQYASQPDFLDGEGIDGYFRRTSVVETSKHEDLCGIPLSELAEARGVAPFDLMLDLALDEGLTTRYRTGSRGTYEELRDLVTDDRTVLGAHDAGAHVDMLCDACYPTFTLRYWVREQGVMSLEHAIWRLSGQPAQLFGIPDRGVVKAGMVADLVAFDPDRVGETGFERLHDFPGNGERLVARSQGVEHVWVAGQAIRSDGADVGGAMPGAVVH